MAANVLWTRAIEFQKVQEWDKLKVTVDMITKLQPHFLLDLDVPELEPEPTTSPSSGTPPRTSTSGSTRGIKFVQDGVSKNKKSPDPDLGHGLVLLPHSSVSRTSRSSLRRLFRDDEDESSSSGARSTA